MSASKLVQIIGLCGALAGAGAIGRDIARAGEPVAKEDAKEKLVKYRRELLRGGVASKGLVERLTPDLYNKDSKEFDEVLVELKDFLWHKEVEYKSAGNEVAYVGDKQKVVDALMRCLSLNGRSLIGSANKSEEIRQLLVREGTLDYKRKLDGVVAEIDKCSKTAEIYRKFVNAPKGSLIDETREKAKRKMEQELAYVGYLKQITGLIKQSAFSNRWHHPEQMDEKADFEEADKLRTEAVTELGELRKAMDNNDLAAIGKHYIEYTKKHTAAQKCYQSGIDTLLKKAEKDIGLKVVGTPLKRITYEGKEFIVAKGFADDHAKINIVRRTPTPLKPLTPIERPKEAAVNENYLQLFKYYKDKSLREGKYGTILFRARDFRRVLLLEDGIWAFFTEKSSGHVVSHYTMVRGGKDNFELMVSVGDDHVHTITLNEETIKKYMGPKGFCIVPKSAASKEKLTKYYNNLRKLIGDSK